MDLEALQQGLAFKMLLAHVGAMSPQDRLDLLAACIAEADSRGFDLDLNQRDLAHAFGRPVEGDA